MTSPVSFGSRLADLDPRALLRNNDVSAKTQERLVEVYRLLAATCAAAAVGAATYQYVRVPSLLSTLGMFACMWAIGASYPGGTQGARVPQLLGFGFCQGLSLGGLIELALAVDATVVPLALAATVVIFVSLSAFAALSPRRSLVYMYAAASSALSWLALASIANYFFQSRAMFEVQLWAGLGVFFGFTLADSQIIIEKLEAGDTDTVKHALDLFVDLAAVFVRVLVILLKSRTDRDDAERRKKARSQAR